MQRRVPCGASRVGGPVAFGPYELLERIAEGGTAEVWRARSRGVAGFEKSLVIKRVLPEYSAQPEYTELLVREAKIAARLSHPNIVQIFELGCIDRTHYIAMELVRGRDLGAVMQRLGAVPQPGEALPLALRLWIAAEVARALDHAHRQKDDEGRPLGIVHRDVSPQNVLLGDEGEVKVADFGIARANQVGLGRDEDPRVLRGKYAYMSPEQARGEPLDRRSDVFSLGVVLWELLTGRRLFRADDPAETLERVRSMPVPRVEAVAPELPRPVGDVVARALSRDRDARYPTAASFATDLSRLIGELGARVGPAELAAAVARLFPERAGQTQNKLLADLVMRALDDATHVVRPYQGGSGFGGPDAERTQPSRVSRRMRAEERAAVLLCTPSGAFARTDFERIVRASGGVPVRGGAATLEALFGTDGEPGHGAILAARAALELQASVCFDDAGIRLPMGPVAIVAGSSHALEQGRHHEPTESTRAAGRALLSEASEPAVIVAADLEHELERAFRLEWRGGRLHVLAFRSRAERDAMEMRRRAPLIGRRAELRQLTEALTDAVAGAGRAVLLEGEMGSGKSRLIAELRSIAAGGGVPCVVGRAAPPGTASFAAIADLLRALCGIEDEEGPGSSRSKVARLRMLGLRDDEVRLLGELLELYDPQPPERRRPGRPRDIRIAVALRRALRSLAADRGALVVLEDVHAMDDATRQLLPLLARGLYGSRLLLVLTARSGTPMPAHVGARLELVPLDAEAGAQLFAVTLGVEALAREHHEALHTLTAGIPSWIEAFAADARAAGIVETTAELARLRMEASIEPGPRALALAEALVASLRPDDREVLRIVAAFERPVHASLLATLTSGPPGSLEGTLRRLARRALLVGSRLGPGDDWRPRGCDGDPGTYHVRGALRRAALLGALRVGDRRALHARIATALERDGAATDERRIAELAHHTACAGEHGRAVDYLVRAADVAEGRGEFRDAASFLERAVDLLRASGDDTGGTRLTALLLRAAEIAVEAGDVDRAMRLVRGSVASDPASMRERHARVQLALARTTVALRAGRPNEALQAWENLEEDLAQLEDGALRARAWLAMGGARLEAGWPAAAVEILARASAAAAEVGLTTLAVEARCRRAVALARSGKLEAASSELLDAFADAARSGEVTTRARALAALAGVEEARGDATGAARRWKQAAELASGNGFGAEAADWLAHAAVALLEAGFDAEASRAADEAIRLARAHRLRTPADLAATVQTALVVEDHPDGEVVPRMVRAVERLEETGRALEAARALAMLARVHVRLGKAAEAARILERGAKLAASAGHAPLAERMRGRAETVRATSPR
ncbi:MAG: protein kinase [Myxococcales bacterium]|nr:protein kinase [Myxococcales bacterium]